MQLLRMVCENRPQWVAKLIAKDSKLLQRFFSGTFCRLLSRSLSQNHVQLSTNLCEGSLYTASSIHSLYMEACF